MIHGIQNGVSALFAKRMTDFHLFIDEVEEEGAHLHLLRQVMMLSALAGILSRWSADRVKGRNGRGGEGRKGNVEKENKGRMGQE